MQLPTDYQSFIHTSRYARWLDSENRRESWEETINRYVEFLSQQLQRKHGYSVPTDLLEALRTGILRLDFLPSMRLLMTAGPAALRDNVCAYNCAYLVVDSPRAFDEALYILMCGTGVGFSVERQYVNQLPVVHEHFERSGTVIVVEDSKAGWAKALRELVSLLYVGQIPTWDTSRVRPAGARLRTFGGRASGPGPLEDLFRFVIGVFRGAAGRRLTSLEAHDIMCKIGEVVVVGGVRRSAMISLSNLSDDRMRTAKTGQWWETAPHRALANNSWVATDRPDMGVFMQEWKALYDSKSGERGIFSRSASQQQAARNGRRDSSFEFGTNPCSEIILRPNQFCNLTECVVREDDTEETLARKVELATILGTFQSTLTDFKYLRKVWKDNTEDERLLGVSLTGILDNALMNGTQDQEELAARLQRLRQKAIDTNAEYADLLGIPRSAAITCVKPSGTVSQLADAASGIHPRHAKFYIRRVRGDKKDPLTQFMRDAGIPVEDCVVKPESTAVFSFPHASPQGALTREDLTAVEHLQLVLAYQRYWCEHKPSVTISVREHEWMEVGAWVWKHFDELSGVSFLPYSDHTYRQAPYEDIDEGTYNELVTHMPDKVSWEHLQFYEKEDTTEGSQSFACSAGACEIVDVKA